MPNRPDSEKQINKINGVCFFKEFTFETNTIPQEAGAAELADSFILLDELVFVFQLKERNLKGETTTETEKNWFDKKVIIAASKQIRDSLRYIDTMSSIKLKNLHGFEVEFSKNTIATLHKLIVYKPNDMLPRECYEKKFYISKSAGFIHVFPIVEYERVLDILQTPGEIALYFEFRETIIQQWWNSIDFTTIPEKALLGQWMQANVSHLSPNIEFSKIIDQHHEKLEQLYDTWDMRGIMSKVWDRTDGNPDSLKMLQEVAKLTRQELVILKERWGKAQEDAFEIIDSNPYYLINGRTACGFVFVPIVLDAGISIEILLTNYRDLFKYHFKLTKCVVFGFIAGQDGWYDNPFLVDIAAWEENHELATIVEENKFRIRPVKTTMYHEIAHYFS